MRLIPKESFQILNREQFNRNDFLGAWVDSTKKLKDDDGKLNPAIIEVRRIPGFSTNKFPPSKKWYLNIRFIKEMTAFYRTLWNIGTTGTYPPKHHYDFNKQRNYYFLKIDDMDGYIDTYENPPKSGDEFQFELLVVHKPLISNYWHFEFKVNSEHGTILEADARWTKLVCSSIIDRIQEKAKFKI